MSSFWDTAYYIKDDPLNQMIWTESPRVQRVLQEPSLLRLAGSFGSQQAMNDAGIVPGVDETTVLPWVPDLVGRNSVNEDGLMVVGTTYAGFISEYSPHRGTLPLSRYYECAKHQSEYADFQLSFVDNVVSPDQKYYQNIGTFLEPAGFKDASYITLLDLCRSSFVLRVGPPGPRKDDSQGTAECAWPIFQQYVEAKEPRGWLWRRVTENPARRVLALGLIAEHGLLRLFTSQLHHPNIRRHRGSVWRNKYGPNEPWAKNYASEKHGIKWWLANSDWWEIDGETEKEARRWRVLPISHPGSRGSDYSRLREVLDEMS